MFLDINSHIEREREGLYHISAPVLGSVHKYSQTAHCGWHRPYPARQSLQLDKLTTVYWHFSRETCWYIWRVVKLIHDNTNIVKLIRDNTYWSSKSTQMSEMQLEK